MYLHCEVMINSGLYMYCVYYVLTLYTVQGEEYRCSPDRPKSEQDEFERKLKSSQCNDFFLLTNDWDFGLMGIRSIGTAPGYHLEAYYINSRQSRYAKYRHTRYKIPLFIQCCGSGSSFLGAGSSFFKSVGSGKNISIRIQQSKYKQKIS